MWRIIWEASDESLLDWHKELMDIVDREVQAGVLNMQTIEVKDLVDGFSVRTTSFNDEELVIDRFNLCGISPDLLDSFIRDNRLEGDVFSVDLNAMLYVKITENDTGDVVYNAASNGFRYFDSPYRCKTFACGVAFRESWTPGSVKVEWRLGEYGEYTTVNDAD